MNINEYTEGDILYLIQVQYGPVASKGTWFSPKSDYNEALEEFLDIIAEDSAIVIRTNEGMAMYIHIGPGAIVMFMTEEMDEHLQMQAKLTPWKR